MDFLSYNSHYLIKLDFSEFGLDSVSNFYIYLDSIFQYGISGNKIRKLHGHIEYCLSNDIHTIITIGGNRSNHLYAASFIPELYGVDVVAIVKGAQPPEPGYTLQILNQKRIPYDFYSHHAIKEDFDSILQIYLKRYPRSLWIPEGGTSQWSDIGFEPLAKAFDGQTILCVSAGTGGTARGLARYSNAQIWAYAALNDYSLGDVLNSSNIHLKFQHTLGGYAKFSKDYFQFLDMFFHFYGILLDPVYTGKMLFGIYKEFQALEMPDDRPIIAIHTGGLQGWYGVWERNLYDFKYIKPDLMRV